MTPSELGLAELTREVYRRTSQAKKRLDELNALCQAYEEKLQPRVEESYENGKTVYKIPRLPDLPHEISLLASEVLHHLRASLDNLVVGLASLCADRPLNSLEERPISFPVYDNKVDFGSFQQRGLSLLDSEYVDLLFRLQSINPEDDKDEDNMKWIRTALQDCALYSNHDKHRRLTVVGAAVRGSGSVSMPGVINPVINIGGLRNNQNFASHLTVEGFGEVSFDFTIYLLNPSNGKPIELSNTLDQLYDAVQDQVIPMFLTDEVQLASFS